MNAFTIHRVSRNHLITCTGNIKFRPCSVRLIATMCESYAHVCTCHRLIPRNKSRWTTMNQCSAGQSSSDASFGHCFVYVKQKRSYAHQESLIQPMFSVVQKYHNAVKTHGCIQQVGCCLCLCVWYPCWGWWYWKGPIMQLFKSYI